MARKHRGKDSIPADLLYLGGHLFVWGILQMCKAIRSIAEWLSYLEEEDVFLGKDYGKGTPENKFGCNDTVYERVKKYQKDISEGLIK